MSRWSPFALSKILKVGPFYFSGNMRRPWGRYEILWHQRSIPDKLNNGLGVCLAGIRVKNKPSLEYYNCINWMTPACSAANEWQKKSALAVISDGYNMTELTFQAGKNAGYGVDNIRIISAPLDPAVSPSASTQPLQSRTNALSRMSAPMNWANRTYVYFSIFGVRPDSTYTPPELAAVKVDVVPPATPFVTATTDGNGTVSAQWVCATSQTQIAQYQYAVGSQPGGCDLKEWVVTIYTSASIPALPVGTSGYVSVVAINHFGFRSTYCSSKFAIIPATEKIAQALAKPENQVVTVCGVVSAVFGDCCYIEAADRTREIKLMGNIAGYKLGDQITVTGALGITNG